MVICITKYLLDKKKQLSKIWLAAHWEKKLKKTQIYEVDIEKSVQDILDTEIILGLRISGHLLIGIVKIHSRKSQYLLTDCSHIFYQVKIYRTGCIDLPEDEKTAAVEDITLNEFMDNFVSIQDDMIVDSMLTANQAHIDEITLKETSENLTLVDDDDLKELVFGEEDESITFDDITFEEIAQLEKPNASSKLNEEDKENGVCNIENQADEADMGVLEPGILDDLLLNSEEVMAQEKSADFLPKEKSKKRKTSVSAVKVYISEASATENILENISERPKNSKNLCNNRDSVSKDLNFCKNSVNLLLEPIRTCANHSSKNKKTKKRKLIVDDIKEMSIETLKEHVSDTSDIMSVHDLAPSTRKLMILKQIGNVEQLFKAPVLRFGNSKLLKLYQRNLKTCKCNDEIEISSESGVSSEVMEESEPESIEKCVDPETVQELEPENMSDDEFNRKNDMADNVPEINFDFPDENFVLHAETENLGKEQAREEEFDQCVPPNDVPWNCKEQKSYSNDFQSTQTSKTSEEKRAYAFQGKIVQMLERLKLLFEKKSVICFSSLVQNRPKPLVAQQFLCILTLKKYEVIALEQSESYGEIFISPNINFDGACSKFCSFC